MFPDRAELHSVRDPIINITHPSNKQKMNLGFDLCLFWCVPTFDVDTLRFCNIQTIKSAFVLNQKVLR